MRKTQTRDARNSDVPDVIYFTAMEVAQNDSETQLEEKVRVACTK